MYKKYDLKYEYTSLEPYIDTRTVGIHYNNHYLKYLSNLNELLEKANFDFRYSLKELINHLDIFSDELKDDISFNLGGVINHELYFDILNPNGRHEVSGRLEEELVKTFGSINNFKDEFIKNALKLKGSGYTNLVLDKDTLKIVNTSNQDTVYKLGYKPIIVLDLWEHAYYLKYQNNRKLYSENFFNLLDFNIIEENYEKAIS